MNTYSVKESVEKQQSGCRTSGTDLNIGEARVKRVEPVVSDLNLLETPKKRLLPQELKHEKPCLTTLHLSPRSQRENYE